MVPSFEKVSARPQPATAGHARLVLSKTVLFFCTSLYYILSPITYLMLVPRDGLALDEREAVGALGEDAVLCDGGQQLPLPRPPQRASLVRDDLGAAVVGHHCNEKHDGKI